MVTSEDLNPKVAYAIKSNGHLWAVTTIRTVGDAFLDHFDRVSVNDPGVDAEAAFPPADDDVIGQDLCCVICEQAYSPLARRRKCPGPKVHPGTTIRGKR